MPVILIWTLYIIYFEKEKETLLQKNLYTFAEKKKKTLDFDVTKETEFNVQRCMLKTGLDPSFAGDILPRKHAECDF